MVLVDVKPFAENLDCMPWESNAIAFRATGGVISSPWCDSTTSSAV
jgi:hypothetical protein